LQEISVLPERVRFKNRSLLYKEDLARCLNAYIDNLAGVKRSTVNPYTASILIEYDSGKINISTIKKNIAIALEAVAGKEQDLWRKYDVYRGLLTKRRKAKRSLLLFGLVYLALKTKHLFFGKSFLSRNVPALQAASIVTILGGYPMLRSMFARLTHRLPVNPDTALSLSGLSLTLGRESTKGVLLLMFKALNDYIKASADAACQRLLEQSRRGASDIAWRVAPAGQEMLVSVWSLKMHDTVAVHAGEVSPVHGRVIRGKALAGTLLYNGQPEFTRMQKGSVLHAGMSVVSGDLHIRVETLPEKEDVPSILNDDLEIEYRIANYERRITPIALGAGALAFLYSGSFMRALAVMLALTPSAAKAAFTTGMKSHIALLNKHRVFLRRTGGIEKLIDADYIVFDKTGTLTEEKLRLQSVTSYDSRFPEQELLRICSACESDYYHPIALSLRDRADPAVPQDGVKDALLIPSRGVQATFERHDVVIGSRKFLREKGVRLSPRASERYTDCEKRLFTPVLVGIDGRLAGMLVLSESIRKRADEMVGRLRQKSAASLVLLTGDNEYKAGYVAGTLGIRQVYSGCSAEEKEEIIRDYKARGPVLMVGDGINDVRAMREADVSVSFAHSSCEQIKAHSDCIIFDDEILRLSDTIFLSQKAYGVMKQSLFLSAAFNAVLGVLALSGQVDAFAAKSYNTVNSLMVLLLNKRIEYLTPPRHFGFPCEIKTTS